MRIIILSLLAFIFSVSSATGRMPDKVGNGGGVWTCQDASGTIHDLMFMDVFEARREYQLTLQEISISPLDEVKLVKQWITTHLPQHQNINKHIEYVEKNITWIQDIINLIPDAANKITPHPSLCKQGDWVATQLVNFTEDFRVLIRKELFDSPLMTDLERAAVYLHEGVYSYLRTEFNDQTSVRARAIVGFLLSDLADDQKVKRIHDVIAQNNNPTNPEPPPVDGYVCGIKPEKMSALYIYVDQSEQVAREKVLQACKDGEQKFPSWPGDIPAFEIPNECKPAKILCEEFSGNQKSTTCSYKSRIHEVDYSGRGRTPLEAKHDAIAKCLTTSGHEWDCYGVENFTCHTNP